VTRRYFERPENLGCNWTTGFPSPWRFGVHFHVHYPEMAPEIIRRLVPALDANSIVEVTHTRQMDLDLSEIQEVVGHNLTSHQVENRGRDILPFLQLISTGAFEGCQGVLKIHTKRSPHRPDGQAWREGLIGSLLGSPQAVFAWKAELMQGATMVFPTTNFVNDRCLSWSQPILEAMLQELNLVDRYPLVRFPAGSMFACSGRFISALQGIRPLLDVFEPETGLTDLAPEHAFERLMGVLAHELSNRE
jgi:hypothetical protein